MISAAHTNDATYRLTRSISKCPPWVRDQSRRSATRSVIVRH